MELTTEIYKKHILKNIILFLFGFIFISTMVILNNRDFVKELLIGFGGYTIILFFIITTADLMFFKSNGWFE